jgi:prepilin-type N-terminal cleavage/methylation domain-containing protein
MRWVGTRSGMTLIEMIITVVIIGLVATIAVPRFLSSVSKSKVDSDARTLTQNCRLARQKAVTESRTYYVTRLSDRAWNVWTFADDGSPQVELEDSTSSGTINFRDDGGIYTGTVGGWFNFSTGLSIEFYSNGSCNGTDVVIENDEGRQVMVDCFSTTGRVRLRLTPSS